MNCPKLIRVKGLNYIFAPKDMPFEVVACRTKRALMGTPEREGGGFGLCIRVNVEIIVVFLVPSGLNVESPEGREQIRVFLKKLSPVVEGGLKGDYVFSIRMNPPGILRTPPL